MGESSLTTEEIIGVFLGIIAIFILIGLSVKLVGIFTFNKDTEQAKATLNELASVSSSLVEGQSKEFLVVGPANWWYLNYDKTLCLCKKDSFCYYSDFKQSGCKSCLCKEIPNKLDFNYQTFDLNAGEVIATPCAGDSGMTFSSDNLDSALIYSEYGTREENCFFANKIPVALNISIANDQRTVEQKVTDDINYLDQAKITTAQNDLLSSIKNAITRRTDSSGNLNEAKLISDINKLLPSLVENRMIDSINTQWYVSLKEVLPSKSSERFLFAVLSDNFNAQGKIKNCFTQSIVITYQPDVEIDKTDRKELQFCTK